MFASSKLDLQGNLSSAMGLFKFHPFALAGIFCIALWFRGVGRCSRNALIQVLILSLGILVKLKVLVSSLIMIARYSTVPCILKDVKDPRRLAPHKLHTSRTAAYPWFLPGILSLGFIDVGAGGVALE